MEIAHDTSLLPDTAENEFEQLDSLSAEVQTKVQERYLKINPSSYGWLLTLNNPETHGYSQELLIGLLQSLHLDCMCMVEEIGDAGTPHYHIYFRVHNKIRFSTVHNLIPEAHIDKPRGTALQCRDYLRKTGTLKNLAKAHTQLPDTYYEWGEFPTANEEKSPEAAALLQMLQQGRTITDILDENANYLLNVNQLNTARTALQEDAAQDGWRKIELVYIWSCTDADLSGIVYQRHNGRDICRIAQYYCGKCRFDSYNGQDVLLLDNFYSDISPRDLLQMANGYPYHLPARFSDKPACYRTMYIVSSIPPEQQYNDRECAELQERFLRRIDTIITIDDTGTITEQHKKPTIYLSDAAITPTEQNKGDSIDEKT
ncbi:MAG: hypothetical protein LKJ90_00665 [Faecalibacterium sp.]|jgi:hypothetical protein|nr:hypothetical protein [Faecalibacterium sp.]